MGDCHEFDVIRKTNSTLVSVYVVVSFVCLSHRT